MSEAVELISCLLEESCYTHVHAGGSELDGLILLAVAPVYELAGSAILCDESDNLIDGCLDRLGVLSTVHLNLTVGSVTCDSNNEVGVVVVACHIFRRSQITV